MRAMWKGSVSFGLVSIPVNLYAATESRNIAFHQVHATDGGRIRMRRSCEIDGQEVPYADIAKGYETEDGGTVILLDADLADLPVPSTKTVEVLEFLPLAAIDPIYFEKSYYLEPQKPGLKPYVLLRDALEKSGKVAVAKIAIRQRESLAVLRVHADVLMIETMLWPDEVRAPEFAFLDQDPPQVRDQELAMAASLIDSMGAEVFEPGEYRDSYREALQQVIDAKIAGEEVVLAEPKERDAEVIDLLAALTASVKARVARERGGAGGSSDAEDSSDAARSGGEQGAAAGSDGGDGKASNKPVRRRASVSTADKPKGRSA